jgi:hypothetical protein
VTRHPFHDVDDPDPVRPSVLLGAGIAGVLGVAVCVLVVLVVFGVAS